MSNNDYEGADWYPGMELPSRKETHGRKKSDRDRKARKEEKQEASKKVETPASIPTVDSMESVEQQWQAYREEVAVTAAIPMPGFQEAPEREATRGDDDGAMPEDEQYLRDLIFEQQEAAEVGEVAEFGTLAEKTGTETTGTETDAEAVPEKEDGPVVVWWKVVLFFLFTPILLVALLAYGKLAYVHKVPDFVRQHVPAYQSGEGFLILKPWWFGPPVFDLNAYPLQSGQGYSQWQTELSDYIGVVQNPIVLRVFPQDILQSK